MFENALLSTLSPARRPAVALPLAIAVHAAVLALLAAASLAREEELAEPPMPIRFLPGRPAPPPSASSPGTTTLRRAGTATLPGTQAREVLSTVVSVRPLRESVSIAPSGEDAGSPPGDPNGDSEGTGHEAGANGTGDGLGAGTEDAIPIGGDVRPPLLLQRVEPDYPEPARKARLSGVVILKAIIDATGRVDDVRVLKSVAPPLDEAAQRAVARWRYTPATLDGRVVRVSLTVTVDFRLH